MPRSIPVAGYESRVDAVFAMKLAGVRSSVIAGRVGIRTTDVAWMWKRAKRTKKRSLKLVQFETDVFTKPALVRGITSDELVRRLLNQIAKEPHLIDAVLDDGAGRLEAAE